MNPKSSPYGSIWRRWDLHFHTPSSYDYADKGATNQQLVEKLVAEGIEVVAVTDHHRIDAARIGELQKLAGEALTVLPGIELRSELGGSDSVHFIGIFPEHIDLKDLWTKLSGKLDITEAEVAKRGDANIYCPFVETAAVIHDLGGLVTVHAGKKHNSIEGLKSSDYIKQVIKRDLVRNHIDIYEVGDISDIGVYHDKVFPHLDRPIPLILCSDNHDIRTYSTKVPLWIKGDKRFESLNQIRFEPLARVAVSADRPLAPLLTVRNVVFDFPTDTELQSTVDGTQHSDPFCFRGKSEIAFSPYLTCLIGGRGSGKSTVLNLLYERLVPGHTEFFSTAKLIPPDRAAIDKCVSIDGDAEQKPVEFLQQDEIEHFATTPLGFTKAIFDRLAKLDKDGQLAVADASLQQEMSDLDVLLERIERRYELQDQIASLEKERATSKALIASFENEDYKSLNSQLSTLTNELQALRSWRSRYQSLLGDLTAMRQKHAVPPSANPNAYETEFFAILTAIEQLTAPVASHTALSAASVREAALSQNVQDQRKRLHDFLAGRGLSPENLADVGKATERIAEIEQELPVLRAREQTLSSEISAKQPNRALLQQRQEAIAAILDPINTTLSSLGSDVKPIELRYEFDSTAFRAAIVETIKDNLGERAPRIDHLASMLEAIDFADLSTLEAFLNAIREGPATARVIRDYFSVPHRFELLKVRAERMHLDYATFGRIRVSYDSKPVERSSFGQRCTAAIVVLLLLGNTPIVIDEPEAHLDSALIANYLVELIKRAKLNRQIIFATHNANFVINGDTELVLSLTVNEDRITKVESFTIEDLEHRKELLALEGGQDAFRKRENRYGL